MKSYLGMYDFPEVTEQTDQWYRTNVDHSTQLGLSAPLSLSRDGSSLEDAGELNSLFIGQTCGWPLVLNAKRLRVVGIPKYSAKGCSDQYYRSVLIVPKDSTINFLKDLDLFSSTNPLKIAVNARNSCSGCLLLAATLGSDILDHSIFLYTGAHEKSITAVSQHQADLAAIDCVSYELLKKHRPSHLEGVRVIGYTLAAPALPYVTSIHASDSLVATLQTALQSSIVSLDDVTANDLFLAGFHFDHPDTLLHQYLAYIKALQHLASSPSQYRLYAATAVAEPLIDPTKESFILKEPVNRTCRDEDRDYLLQLQPSDALYIDELLQQIDAGVAEVSGGDAADTREYSTWKTYGEQQKPVRLIYPGGRGIVAELIRKIQTGRASNTLNVVCFLGLRKQVHQCSYNDVDVVVDCWESDAHIVARLNPAVVIAYATGEVTPGGDWGNVVLFQQGHNADSNLMLDSSAAGSDGTPLTPQQHGAHRHAIQEVSPWYYKEVRIHRAIVSLSTSDGTSEKCNGRAGVTFQRTLYSKFLNGVVDIEPSSSDASANNVSSVSHVTQARGSKYSVSDGVRQRVVKTVRNVFNW